jgi:cobalt-precorrin-5B (C1)-methyltransferase
VTDKALISATLSKISPSEVSEKDYVIEDGEGVLVLRGGEGVGLATRAGLAADKASGPSIPFRRSMILEKPQGRGLRLRAPPPSRPPRSGRWRGTRQTHLNPTLGVLGGISILGTSGFVEPYSNAAYVDTIKVMVSGAKAAGAGRVVLCTGGSTLKAAMKLHPDLP